MKVNKHYWIHVNGIVHKYIPMYRNYQGEWCYDLLSTRLFITDTTLKTLHGDDCIIREVDFDNDTKSWSENINLLEFFISDNDEFILFGTKHIFYYTTANTWEINQFENTKVLTFKE